MERGETVYSKQIKGNARNHNLPARFDISDGYVGITQKDGDKVTDRALLSPAQVRALMTFLSANIAQ